MRKEFSLFIERLARRNKRIVFLTADLGFNALEKIRSAIGDRFINVGISEQNMISMAAGLAGSGYTPICYSIAPFAVFRPAEQTRIDICLHNLNVKIVGNGGGYGYGIMGATHHAIEDIAFMSSLQNMRCYIPYCNEDVDAAVASMMRRKGPAYLRLGLGSRPPGVRQASFAPIRKLNGGRDVTVVALGPSVLNVFEALKTDAFMPTADIFVVSEMPLLRMSPEFERSVLATKRLIVIEEHVARGGLAENLGMLLLQRGIACHFTSLHVSGYPNGLYGSQAYHQRVNGIDPVSIAKTLLKMRLK